MFVVNRVRHGHHNECGVVVVLLSLGALRSVGNVLQRQWMDIKNMRDGSQRRLVAKAIHIQPNQRPLLHEPCHLIGVRKCSLLKAVRRVPKNCQHGFRRFGINDQSARWKIVIWHGQFVVTSCGEDLHAIRLTAQVKSLNHLGGEFPKQINHAHGDRGARAPRQRSNPIGGHQLRVDLRIKSLRKTRMAGHL